MYYITAPTQEYDFPIKFSVWLLMLHIFLKYVFILANMLWSLSQTKQSWNSQWKNRSSGEWSSCLFETYKNTVRPHGCHIYNYTENMAMAKMHIFLSRHNGIPHCKCVLICCDE